MSIAFLRFTPLRAVLLACASPFPQTDPAQPLAGTDADRTLALRRYALLTEHTSFIAVDELIVDRGGAGATVDRPQPLPKGVGQAALGAVQQLPEPEFAALTALVRALACWMRCRCAGAAKEAHHE
jgi:hypothetical protein